MKHTHESQRAVASKVSTEHTFEPISFDCEEFDTLREITFVEVDDLTHENLSNIVKISFKRTHSPFDRARSLTFRFNS